MIQKTDWGQIEWIHTSNESAQSFTVGITSLLKGKRMQKHVHYGLEQFIYILDGEGVYYINDERVYISKNMYFYLEPDIVHETINLGSGPLKELVVSRPISYNSNNNPKEEYLSGNNNEFKITNSIIYSAVEAIRTTLLKSISIPFVIYNDLNEIVIQNNKFSSYCTSHCNPLNNHENCRCILQKNSEIYNKFTQLTCEYGLTVFFYPIIYNGVHLGTIAGGHILVSNYTTEEHDDLYDTPVSTVIGIKNMLMQIVKSILSYCSFYESRMLIAKKDNDINEEIKRNEVLTNNLFIINEKVTNLRINHHFLFNTLNSIASLALNGKRNDLYNAIIDLSKMFRYIMTLDLKFVPLASEIEYLETYLNLQKLRYGSDLEVNYFIEDKINTICVPFNFIQPIVENAFTHGFIPSNNKKVISISVRKVDNKAEIIIRNNGVLIDDITLNRVNHGVHGNTGHGLSLVYEKLKLAYNSDFSMHIESTTSDYTNVIVEIPIIFQEESHD